MTDGADEVRKAFAAAQRGTRDIDRAYRAMHALHLAGLPPDHIRVGEAI